MSSERHEFFLSLNRAARACARGETIISIITAIIIIIIIITIVVVVVVVVIIIIIIIIIIAVIFLCATEEATSEWRLRLLDLWKSG